jgi:hypothetical protein
LIPCRSRPDRPRRRSGVRERPRRRGPLLSPPGVRSSCAGIPLSSCAQCSPTRGCPCAGCRQAIRRTPGTPARRTVRSCRPRPRTRPPILSSVAM